MSVLINTGYGQEFGLNVPLWPADRQYILDKHNEVRNQVAAGNYGGLNGNLPPATNMNELLWV